MCRGTKADGEWLSQGMPLPGRPAAPPAAAPAPPAPVRWAVTPQRPGPRLPPLGFALTRVTLTSSLGPAAARGPSFVAPASGRRVFPSGRRGLVCWRPSAPADNGINPALPRSHPLNCHRVPRVPRLGTDCIPQRLSTSLTHPWHLSGTGDPWCTSNPARGHPGHPFLHLQPPPSARIGSGRTRQDQESASRGLKNSRTPVTAGGVSPALGLRASTGAPSQPLPLNHIPAPCLLQH